MPQFSRKNATVAGATLSVKAVVDTHARSYAVRCVDWGRLAYEEALVRQRELVRSRLAGSAVDTIVCVEHPPTITLGRHAPATDVLLDHDELSARGISLVRTDRGGRATYHGPGQAVIYPVVELEPLGLGVKGWVCLLESILIETLSAYGIAGQREAGRPGIYVGPAKVASVGLRVVRGISYHGVSINVAPDVSGFETIVTCGVGGQRVTSLALLGASGASREEVSRRFSGRLAAALEAAAARTSPGSCR